MYPTGKNLSFHLYVLGTWTVPIPFTAALWSVILQEAPLLQLAPAMYVSINCAADMASSSYQCLNHFPEPFCLFLLNVSICLLTISCWHSTHPGFLLISAKALVFLFSNASQLRSLIWCPCLASYLIWNFRCTYWRVVETEIGLNRQMKL